MVAAGSWLRRLGAYYGRYRLAAVLSLAGALGGNAVAALTPLFAAKVIDNVIVAQRQPLAPWLAVIIAAGVVRFVFSMIRRFYANRLALGVGYSLRTDVFRSLQLLDGTQQDRMRTGQVVSRSISDMAMVERSLENVPLVVTNIGLFVMSLSIMAVLSPLLTVVALAMAPVLYLVARRGNAVLFPAAWDYTHRNGEVAGVVEAAVSGVRVVKGLAQEEREQERLEKHATAVYASGTRRARLASRYLPALNAIPALGQVGVLAFGGWLALRGNITLGTFLAFATYLALLIAPVRIFVGQFEYWQTAKAAFLRVLEIIDTQPEIIDRPNAERVPPGAPQVEFDGVTVGYDSSQPVLHDVSLRVDPGETLAIVGGTGSGKSTIGLLLSRLYDPRAGVVRLGGRDIRNFALSSLRARIGMVFEESFLFSDTVGANIAFGRPDVTHDQIVAAARAAAADEFIRELPDGYDTVIGERGLTLSGGQRQRVALARALLTDPHILVLDDATSAVDAGVEAEIHATLRQVMRDRTTLLIAHRRSTLQLADRIAVLHHGQVVDSGTHEELLSRCPRYRLLLTGHDEELEAATDGEFPIAETVTERLWNNPPPSDDAGGAFGTTSLPPDQAAKVARLPPTTDVPDIDLEDARRPEPEFSLPRLVRPFLTGLSLVVVLLAADTLAQIAFPWLTRVAIDGGVTPDRPGVLFGVSATALAVVLAASIAQTVQERAVGRAGEGVLYWLRVKTYAHLQRLGLDFYERERGGHIMTRMTADTDSIKTFTQTGLAQAVIAALTFVGVMGAMFALDIGLAVAVCVAIVAFTVSVSIYRNYSTKAYSAARERLSELNSYFQEHLAGVRVTQAFRRENHNVEKFRELAAEYRSAQMRAQMCIALFLAFGWALNELTVAIVLGVGASRVAAGNLTVGGLIAFLLYITMLFNPIQQMSQVFDGYQRARVGLRRIGDLLRTPTSTPQPDYPVVTDKLTGDVAFDHVRFRYTSGAEEALRGISLDIHPGETVAVVGETGAGKSTLLKLLARFYDPTTGSVRVDGTDLRDIDLPGYRRRLGIVPQEPYLFSGNVRDAIAYGKPDATNAEVEGAARAVGAHDMIATLRHGYLHPLGERGHNLSAGQRQLLALARAQLVDPDVLLLDEATAALDLATEAAVTQASSQLARQRTTLLIAHRLTTAARADRIIVLHHGRIAETGTHDQLLATDGRYSALWRTFTGQHTARPHEPVV